MFNDPSNVLLATRMDVLSTMFGTKSHYIHPEYGFLVAKEEHYDILGDLMPITSKIPLELQILPEGTMEELPAGTTFYFVRTDGGTYVDMRLEDGRECRIEFETDGWERSINGVPEWDCFEQLWYAG